jgi:hypothetical protein
VEVGKGLQTLLAGSMKRGASENSKGVRPSLGRYPRDVDPEHLDYIKWSVGGARESTHLHLAEMRLYRL